MTAGQLDLGKLHPLICGATRASVLGPIRMYKLHYLLAVRHRRLLVGGLVHDNNAITSKGMSSNKIGSSYHKGEKLSASAAQPSTEGAKAKYADRLDGPLGDDNRTLAAKCSKSAKGQVRDIYASLCSMIGHFRAFSIERGSNLLDVSLSDVFEDLLLGGAKLCHNTNVSTQWSLSTNYRTKSLNT